MTEEEMKNLKQTVDYFGHWYVIGYCEKPEEKK